MGTGASVDGEPDRSHDEKGMQLIPHFPVASPMLMHNFIYQFLVKLTSCPQQQLAVFSTAEDPRLLRMELYTLHAFQASH